MATEVKPKKGVKRGVEYAELIDRWQFAHRPTDYYVSYVDDAAWVGEAKRKGGDEYVDPRDCERHFNATDYRHASQIALGCRSLGLGAMIYKRVDVQRAQVEPGIRHWTWEEELVEECD